MGSAVRNLDRDSILASHCDRAERMLERMRGLLGRDRLGEGEGLWITPCNSIHTFGMRFAIDVLFLDREGKVLRRYDRLPPWRMTRIVRGATAVLELPAGALSATGTEPGDRVAISKDPRS